MARTATYAGKRELLAWVSSMLSMQLDSLNDLMNGAVWLQLLDAHFADAVPMHKVDFTAHTYEQCMVNYKILQRSLDRADIQRDVDIKKMLEGHQSTLLEFLQWCKHFFSRQRLVIGYNPRQRRAESKHGGADRIPQFGVSEDAFKKWRMKEAPIEYTGGAYLDSLHDITRDLEPNRPLTTMRKPRTPHEPLPYMPEPHVPRRRYHYDDHHDGGDQFVLPVRRTQPARDGPEPRGAHRHGTEALRADRWPSKQSQARSDQHASDRKSPLRGKRLEDSVLTYLVLHRAFDTLNAQRTERMRQDLQHDPDVGNSSALVSSAAFVGYLSNMRNVKVFASRHGDGELAMLSSAENLRSSPRRLHVLVLSQLLLRRALEPASAASCSSIRDELAGDASVSSIDAVSSSASFHTFLRSMPNVTVLEPPRAASEPSCFLDPAATPRPSGLEEHVSAALLHAWALDVSNAMPLPDLLASLRAHGDLSRDAALASEATLLSHLQNLQRFPNVALLRSSETTDLCYLVPHSHRSGASSSRDLESVLVAVLLRLRAFEPQQAVPVDGLLHMLPSDPLAASLSLPDSSALRGVLAGMPYVRVFPERSSGADTVMLAVPFEGEVASRQLEEAALRALVSHRAFDAQHAQATERLCAELQADPDLGDASALQSDAAFVGYLYSMPNVSVFSAAASDSKLCMLAPHRGSGSAQPRKLQVAVVSYLLQHRALDEGSAASCSGVCANLARDPSIRDDAAALASPEALVPCLRGMANVAVHTPNTNGHAASESTCYLRAEALGDGMRALKLNDVVVSLLLRDQATDAHSAVALQDLLRLLLKEESLAEMRNTVLVSEVALVGYLYSQPNVAVVESDNGLKACHLVPDVHAAAVLPRSVEVLLLSIMLRRGAIDASSAMNAEALFAEVQQELLAAGAPRLADMQSFSRLLYSLDYIQAFTSKSSGALKVMLGVQEAQSQSSSPQHVDLSALGDIRQALDAAAGAADVLSDCVPLLQRVTEEVAAGAHSSCIARGSVRGLTDVLLLLLRHKSLLLKDVSLRLEVSGEAGQMAARQFRHEVDRLLRVGQGLSEQISRIVSALKGYEESLPLPDGSTTEVVQRDEAVAVIANATVRLNNSLRAVGVAQSMLPPFSSIAVASSVRLLHVQPEDVDESIQNEFGGATPQFMTTTTSQAFKIGPFQYRKLRNGDTYVGRYENSKKSGEAVYIFSNGDQYEGTFARDQMEGAGVYTFMGQGRYEGQWKAARYHGHGSETFAKGSTYTGQYEAGSRAGWGTCRYFNGDYYEGTWANGVRNGTGMQQCTDGSNYVGEYKDAKRVGLGVYTFHNGDCYLGQYEADLPNGLGIYVFQKGQLYAGSWREGKKHGLCSYTIESGECYVGEWESGKPIWVQSLGFHSDADLDSLHISPDMMSKVLKARGVGEEASSMAEQAKQLAAEHWNPAGTVQQSLSDALEVSDQAAFDGQRARARGMALAYKLDSLIREHVGDAGWPA